MFYSGDTGAFEGFTDVGTQYGPFDLAIIKIGAYGSTWPDIHLTPEQAVAVHRQVGGRVLLPVHWGTFNLAFHDWNEPAERLLVAAREAGASVMLPQPGQPIDPLEHTTAVMNTWWREDASDRRPAT